MGIYQRIYAFMMFSLEIRLMWLLRELNFAHETKVHFVNILHDLNLNQSR